MAGTRNTTDPSASDDEADRPGKRRDAGGLSDWLEALRDVAPYLDLGWRLAGAASFPPLIGYAIDVWLGTLPWGVLIGAAVGLASAGVQLRRLQSELDR